MQLLIASAIGLTLGHGVALIYIEMSRCVDPFTDALPASVGSACWMLCRY
jgi:hypothetical protein